MILSSGTAFAHLINVGQVSFSGGVAPAIPTLLTLQPQGTNTTETGCVGLSGAADVMGSCLTSSGTFAGGNEIATTQTQLVSAAHALTVGVSSYANLALVVTVNQPAGTPINMNNLILSIYSPAGALQGSVAATCPAGGCVLNPTPGGIGNETNGYLFQVTSDEVASLGTFSSANRVGIATSFTNAAPGAETIWLASTTAAAAVPEPGSLLLLGGGLIAVAAARRRR